jgi:hypothetical protein
VPRLLVWGDSHAMCLLPGIEALCIHYRIAARAATQSSAVPVLDYARGDRWPGRQQRFNDAVLNYIRDSAITDVMLVGRWAGSNTDPAFPPALLKTVERVKALKVRVYVVNDVPDYRCDVPETLAQLVWRGKNPSEIAKYRNDYRRDNAAYLSLGPSLRRLGATVLEPERSLDAANNGLPFDAGGSFYADAQHLSAHGAMIARAALEPVAKAMVRDR